MSRIKELEEQQLSWREKDATVAKLNEMLLAAPVSVETVIPPSFQKWLTACQELAKDSEGAFDVTIAPLSWLWNIEGEHPTVPDEADIDRALKQVGYDRLQRGEKGVQLDLGAVGKGIACDEIAELSRSFTKLSGTISIGGSIAVLGHKPDNTPWKLGIQNPRGETGEVMGILAIDRDCFLSTSGDYEKYFMENGKRYHHILDARTGYPAASGLISVTILSDSGLESDALSTACFVLGMEQGMALVKKYGAEAVFIDEGKQVTVTEGLKDIFEITDEEYRLAD